MVPRLRSSGAAESHLPLWRTAMRIVPVLLAGSIAASASLLSAQPDFALHARRIVPAAPDPAIARAIARIDPARIHQIIAKLVSFETRSTLSSMETDLPPAPASMPPPTGFSASSSKSPATAAAVSK